MVKTFATRSTVRKEPSCDIQFFVNGSAYKQQQFPCKRRRCWCAPRRTHIFSAQRAMCHTSHLALSPSTRSLLHMFRIRCTTESATARACGSSRRTADNALSTIWEQTSESFPTDSSSSWMFFFVARRVEMDMHALRMNDNKGGMKCMWQSNLRQGLIRSLGEDTRVANVVGSVKRNCREWSRYHEESEWSLIASLICPFSFPWWHGAERSFRRIRRSCFSWCDCALRRSKSRWSHTSWCQLWSVCLMPRASWGMEHAPWWRTFHLPSESGVWGFHRRPPTYLELLKDPTTVWSWEASAKRSQQRPLQWY